jgi:hypothetical protein
MSFDIDDFDAAGPVALEERTIVPEWWKLPNRNFSATSLSMFARCPEQFRHRYILGEKRRPGEALVIGSAFHSTAEFNFGQKIESHEDLPVAELKEHLLGAAWPEQLARQQEDAGVEIEWDTKEGDCLDRTIAMVDLYAEVSPRIQPLAVEEKLDIAVGLPITLIGYTDVRTEHSIIDLKTTKTARQSVKPDWQLQARIYGMARNLPVDFHIVSPKKTITPLEYADLSIFPSDAQKVTTLAMIRELGLRANQYLVEYGPFETWPTFGAINEQYNKQICGYCGWSNVCPAANGGRVVIET